MIVYRIDCRADHPVAVECKEPGYPNRDANGDMMYHNTHYANEREAWDHIRESSSLEIWATGRRIADARERLRKLEEEAGKAAERASKVKDQYDDWQRNQE